MLRIVKGFAPRILIDGFKEMFLSVGVPGGPLGFMRLIRVGILQRLSEFVRTRRKAVLRSEGFTWVPVLRSFNKLREVGVLSYLSFTLCLSVL